MVFRGIGAFFAYFGFFIILFLATWAGGVWITPIGQPLWGVYWLPYLLVGLIFMFLLLALIPDARPPRTRREKAQQQKQEIAAMLAFDAFFWIMVAVFTLVILTHYLF